MEKLENVGRITRVHHPPPKPGLAATQGVGLTSLAEMRRSNRKLRLRRRGSPKRREKEFRKGVLGTPISWARFDSYTGGGADKPGRK